MLETDLLERITIFLQDKWFVVLIALIALFVIIKIVNTVLKWILVLAIVIGLVAYGANYTGTIKDISGQIMNYTLDEVTKMVLGSSEAGEYREQEDGTFTIESSLFTIHGKKGSNEITVEFRGQTFTVKLNNPLQKYIEEVRTGARP